MSTCTIEAAQLAQALADGQELALIDVSEPGVFGEGHALLAVNLPFSRLELDISTRVPHLATRIVLIAPDNVIGERAAAALRREGYTDVAYLRDGIHAWAALGQPVFQGVNVPSKAFAEVVEQTFHTPEITASELDRLLREKADVIVLDSRTVEEHRRFHVRDAISCPGSELVHRFGDLVPDPSTLVVVSCAGRTRGVMGAQTLINAGVPNRVVALSGGTQGWRLAGLPLVREPGQESSSPSEASRAAAHARAQAIVSAFGVPDVTAQTVAQWLQEPDRTTYLFDVRTQQEFDAAHVNGAIWAQGVQLIQCLDQWAAVRGARVVLIDDDGVRARVTAHWLRQLGWDTHALAPDQQSWRVLTGPVPRTPAWADIDHLDAGQAERWIQDGALLLDARSSASYRQAHPQGARWANRSAGDVIQTEVQAARRIVVLAEDEAVARLLAQDLVEDAVATGDIAILEGGFAAWRAAGLPVESTPASPPDDQRIDYLFWLHDRHDGNNEASAAYLQWEIDLPAAIGYPSSAGFRLQIPGQTPP